MRHLPPPRCPVWTLIYCSAFPASPPGGMLTSIMALTSCGVFFVNVPSLKNGPAMCLTCGERSR